MGGGDAQVLGITEAGDVVADDRAGRARGVEHRRAPGVDRHWRVEARDQGVDRRHDALELLGLADLGTGSGPHTTDIEEVDAIADVLLGAPEKRVEVPGRAAVVERVGRAVEDAHHHGAVACVERHITEPQTRKRFDGRDRHGERQ
jgi:hypothetical protein